MLEPLSVLQLLSVLELLSAERELLSEPALEHLLPAELQELPPCWAVPELRLPLPALCNLPVWVSSRSLSVQDTSASPDGTSSLDSAAGNISPKR